MLNRVILMGRMVSDPELKTTGSGTNVTSFTIAVDRNYVKQGEERKADFIGIVCWRQQAEFVCRYFGKGSLIAIEGQLQTRTYQAKDGTNRNVVEVMAENVSFTGERRDNNQPSAPTQQNNQGQRQNQQPPQGGYAPTQGGYAPTQGQPQQSGYQQSPQNGGYPQPNQGNAYQQQPTQQANYQQPPMGYSGVDQNGNYVVSDDDLPF